MRVRRRDFIAGVAGAVVWPVVAGAQQPGGMRVVLLTNVAESDVDERSRVAAFRHELRQRGWVEGNNVHLDYRWTAGSNDLARTFAAEIVGMKPAVIFVAGTTTVSIVLQHTRSIPVVFVTGADPVQVGFVESLARPGGNATGFAEFEDAMGTKWLEVLKEAAPTLARVVFLHSESRATLMQLPALQDFAASIGVQLLPTNVRNAADIERALDSRAGEAHLGLILPPSSLLAVHRKLILARAAEHRFPAIYPNRRYAADGGLVSYGADRVEQYRRAAAYVDRILKGEKPADLPTQLATKFELVVNLKAAKAIGLTIPRSLLARADEVIE